MLIDPDYGQQPLADRATARRDLSLIIERAIEALDALDGDPDYESEDEEDESDREPSLGAPEGASPVAYRVDLCGYAIPSLAFRVRSQARWAGGSRLDLEECHDGREEDDDGGGDILDEPHDAEEDRCADADALHLFYDEMWFVRQMEDTRDERQRAREGALQRLADITGRPAQSQVWPRVTFRPEPHPRADGPLRAADVDGRQWGNGR